MIYKLIEIVRFSIYLWKFFRQRKIDSLKKGTKGKNLLELWRKEIKDISRNNLFVILYDQLERKSSERAKKDNLTGCSKNIPAPIPIPFQFLE